MEFRSTFSGSKIYQSFEMIDRSAFQTVIRFFEENTEEIKELDFEEYFEILVAYVQALFDVGAYQKHSTMANIVIEASIINNLNVFKGINIFEKTLFQKSASFYNLHRFEESLHIITELLKINPLDKTYKAFWIKNKLSKKPSWMISIQGLSIACFFATIITICISTFYIEPFKSEYISWITVIRNLFFLSGILLLIFTDGFYRFRVFYQVHQLIKDSKEKMKKKF